MAEVVERLDSVERRLTSVETGLSDLREQVGGLREEVGGLREEVGGLRGDVHKLRILGEKNETDIMQIAEVQVLHGGNSTKPPWLSRRWRAWTRSYRSSRT